MTNRPSPEAGLIPGGSGAVVLISGGIDSAVMLARTLASGRAAWPLYVRQGALWEDAEEAALRRFLSRLDHATTINPDNLPPPGRLGPLHVLRLDLPANYASRWALDPDTPVPGDDTPDKAVYLPGRNLALFLQGAGLAQSLGVHAVQIGLLAGNPFADSTPAFIEDFCRLYAKATQYGITIESPLAGLAKAEVIRAGAALPLEDTFSCLRPLGNRHCGQCNKCAERRRGFALAGLADPTPYAQPAVQFVR